MSEENKIKIHEILNKYLSDYLQTQEINYATSKIIKSPTIETINNMIDYLDSFDTIRFGSGAGQSYLVPNTNTKTMTANNIRFAMSEIRKLLSL